MRRQASVLIPVSAVSRDITQSVYDNIKIIVASIASINTVADALNADAFAIVDANISSINTIAGLHTEIYELANIIDILNSLYADKDALNSLYNDKSTLDSLYADKVTLDSLFADKTQLDAIYLYITEILAIYTNLTSILEVANIVNDVVTVASIKDEVITVSTANGNITLLTSNIDSINTVANNIINVNNFADMYTIGTVSPTNPNEGWLWFDTNVIPSVLKIYNNSTWVDITSYIATNALLTTLQFSGGTGTQYTLSANTDEKTLDLIQNGTTLQLGLELLSHVINGSGSTILNGTPVMTIGTAGASGKCIVAPMDASTSNNLKNFVGIATEDIVDGAEGKITFFGKVRSLDTSMYSENDDIWLDPINIGGLTNVQPDTEYLAIHVGKIITSDTVNGNMSVLAIPRDENAVSRLQLYSTKEAIAMAIALG